MRSFSERLNAAIVAKGTPAMIGVDPQWELLPPMVRQSAVANHGAGLEAMAAAYRDFCRVVLDRVADLVPVVKFQSAFFEAAGPLGLVALADLMDVAGKLGLIVVLDGKRNDIGSTATAYAEGYLGAVAIDGAPFVAWGADALTINPYLGAEGVQPFIDVCQRKGAGVFVLVRTSNPGAGKLQDLIADGQPIYRIIAKWVEDWAGETAAGERFGAVGAVVGATVPQQVVELREQMPHSILLIPGYGAQGGTSADVAAAFADDGLGAVVNSSRGILYAYRATTYENLSWPDAITAATRAMIDDLARHTPAGKLR